MTFIRSFAKINLGLKIGPPRADGFHELRTIYQTIALHDLVHVDLLDGDGIQIRCADARVPLDASNTCYKVAERMMRVAKTAGRVIITIDKQLPVQGGMGAASSNAVATLIALERELNAKSASARTWSNASPRISAQDKMRIAAEVGSDLPLFLIGGTILGVDRGQEVYPLQDLPSMPLVVVTPPIGVSTPKAFAQWDALVSDNAVIRSGGSPASGEPESKEIFHRPVILSKGAGFAPESKDPFSGHQPLPTAAQPPALTHPAAPVTISTFSQSLFAWLENNSPWQAGPAAGVPARGGDRAETPLLDLVRTGIENDFERVVFPEYPELRDVKRVLEREGAVYASLSGSGSTLYGIFASDGDAKRAAGRMSAAGHVAVATSTVTRGEYWKQLLATSC